MWKPKLFNIWNKIPIDEVTVVGPSTKISGRVKPRVLEAKPYYRDLINRLIEQKLEHMIDINWFNVIYEGPWQPNLITLRGKNVLATSSLRAWNTYQYGAGTATPLESDTSLGSYVSYTTNLVDLPSSYVPNIYDYVGGTVTVTRCWLSSVFTSDRTITEGGISNSNSGNLYTKFLLETPITVATGYYFSPVYQLSFALSPTTSSAIIDSPVLTGWNTSAAARIESLLGVIPPVNIRGSFDQYISPLPISQLAIDINDTYLRSSNTPSVNYHDIYNSGYFLNILAVGLPNLMYVHPFFSYIVLSTDSDSLVFNSSGHVFNNTDIITATPYPSTTEGASSAQQSYTDGTFTRTQRQYFSNSYGNMTGIRSIAIAMIESPYGSTAWQYRSIYRVLLDQPMVKDSDHILTLDFVQSWS